MFSVLMHVRGAKRLVGVWAVPCLFLSSAPVSCSWFWLCLFVVNLRRFRRLFVNWHLCLSYTLFLCSDDVFPPL